MSRSLLALRIRNLLPDRARDPFDVSCLRLGFRAARINEDGDGRSGGYEIADQLKPLCVQLGSQKVQARGVATRPIENS